MDLNGSTSTFPGFQSGDIEAIQTLLFGKGNLNASEVHTIHLASMSGGGVLDFDYVRRSSLTRGWPY